LAGVIRDAFFFVPGGRWVSRRLCAERELAADQLAVSVTRRPGALASGLLKALDVHRPTMACASFSAPSAVVMRVERLVADEEVGRRGRATVESAAVAGALTVALALSLYVPAVVASNAEEGWGRNALALLWTWPVEEVTTVSEPAVFEVYSRSTPFLQQPRPSGTGPADAGREFHPAFLRGELPYAGTDARVHTLGQETSREMETRQFRVTPLVAANEGLGVFWLHELRAGQ
jgi:hypothetical protein